MRPRSMAKTLKGTVKEVLGTAQSVGCTIDEKPPHDLIDEVNEGVIDIPDN
jgi:large subunit ribosomal protein L12e